MARCLPLMAPSEEVVGLIPSHLRKLHCRENTFCRCCCSSGLPPSKSLPTPALDKRMQENSKVTELICFPVCHLLLCLNCTCVIYCQYYFSFYSVLSNYTLVIHLMYLMALLVCVFLHFPHSTVFSFLNYPH